jgi:hypothetical protein
MTNNENQTVPVAWNRQVRFPETAVVHLVFNIVARIPTVIMEGVVDPFRIAVKTVSALFRSVGSNNYLSSRPGISGSRFLGIREADGMRPNSWRQ